MGPTRVITVRKGSVQPGGSWLYVWIDVDTGEVAFVGATGFDPELRAHLHLTSDVPELGRVRATVPRYDQRDFDVLAFELPDDADRSAAKRALVERLADEGDSDEANGASGLDAVLDAIVLAVAERRAPSA